MHDHDHDDDDFPTTSFDEIEALLEEHEAAELLHIDRNHVNGYRTFKFYDVGGNLAGKLVFDEPEEDMAARAAAVLDHLSSTPHTVVYQIEVEEVWDRDPPAPRHPGA